MSLRSLFVLLFALLAAPAAAQTIPSGSWGSLNYWGVGGLSQVLAPGSAGQCLTTQGVGSAPVWVNCQVSSLSLLPPINTNQFYGNVSGNFQNPIGVDVNTILNTVGYDIVRPPAPESILYKSNVGPTFNWQTLAPGAAGSLLTSGGATNPPFWSTNPTQAGLAAICQTVGAILYFDTPSSTWHCLNPGTSGQVLQTGGASGNPSWLTISANAPVTYSNGTIGITGTALTASSDTNVTATLGGSPSGALLAPSSITMGWAGTLAVARGGTGGGSASGTLLDNITGFSSTGFMTRQGAGSYSFQSTTNGITNANLAQMAANTVKCNPTGSTANAQDCTTLSAKTGGTGIDNSASATNDTLAYNGTGFIHTAIITLLNTVCTAAPSTCATFFGYANPIWWGADSTGVSDSASAINSAIVASKTVSVSQGTYRIGSAIAMQPGVRFTCSGATITQANSANLTVFFDFFTNAPNGAQLDHCTIDGNRANNTNLNTIMVDLSGVSNVNILSNTLTGSTGGVIAASNSTFLTVEHNVISNSINYGVAIFNTIAGIRGYHQIRFNTITGPMLHLMQLQQVDGNEVSGNILQGVNAIGGAASAMQVTVSGTSATSVSGTNFSSISTNATAQVLVCNGGLEYPITAWVSNTQLTISNPVPNNFVNQPCAIGGGDVLSLTNLSFNRVTNNLITGGVTGGIVLANQGGAISSTESSLVNILADNYIEDSGNFGIALEAPAATGNPQVSQTTITGNFIFGPGRSGTAGASPGGIQLTSATNLMIGVLIDGNYVYDPFTVASGFWVTGSGAANATLVNFGSNTPQGFANGSSMSGYPTFASLAATRGAVAHIIDGLAANCGDAACTTWATTVNAGGGALKLNLWFNGTNWTLIGK